MTTTVPAPLRVYIAGPYSAMAPGLVKLNVFVAIKYAEMVMALGHEAFCPHAATHWIAVEAKTSKRPISYDRWMGFDLGILEAWATALFVISDSPGVLREITAAKAKGIPIYRSLLEVPEVKP